MTPKQDVRSALTGAGEAGDDYQADVVGQIEDVFGEKRVWQSGAKVAGKNRPAPVDLVDGINQLKPFDFLIEAKFKVPTAFAAGLGLADLRDSTGLLLDWSDLNPDILLVLPARATGSNLSCAFSVAPDGTSVPLPPDDGRLQLRVMDVKLASQPGAHYFAEVVYYSMALAAWLQAEGWDAQFVVTANGAVWPGTYEKSKLWQKHVEGIKSGLGASVETLLEAMEVDLEVAEFGVYVPRVRRFFQYDLPRIVKTPWHELEWHLGYRCGGCDFLGYDWKVPGKAPDALACWPQAEREASLSRIQGLSRGSARWLREQGFRSVPDVATSASSAPAWKNHSTLRAKGEVFRARAEALQSGAPTAITGSASAVIPSWADLRIFLTLDYDPSTALTAVFSMRAAWKEPTPFKSERQPRQKKWGSKGDGYIVRLVMDKDPDAEEREFLGLLHDLKTILDEVRIDDDARVLPAVEAAKAADEKCDEKRSSYQIYLWDNAQFRQLCRLVTRHLTAVLAHPDLAGLAWLFPSESLLPDPELATRKSPISLVGEAVEMHLALPIPHYYPINEVAQTFLPSPPPPMGDYYCDPLTNLIPPERLHEFWNPKPTQNKMTLAKRLETNSALKTLALGRITSALISHPGITLSRNAAPTLVPSILSRKSLDPKKATPESLLWYEWTRLESALSEVEAQMFYALPPQEREARFGSAHLRRRLEGQEEKDALAKLNLACNVKLKPATDLLVYELSPHSRDVKIKLGEFTWALSPREEILFLDRVVSSDPDPGSYSYLPQAPRYLPEKTRGTIGSLGLTEVSLEGIDRQNGLIALRASAGGGRKIANAVAGMEKFGDADFATDVMLDPVPSDFWTSKVKATLEALGQPDFETEGKNADGESFLPQLPPRLITPQKRGRKVFAAHDLLYRPRWVQSHERSRSVPTRKTLLAQGVNLNPSQWDAWATALTRDLTLVWGPPGTGKSETLRAIVRGAVVDAQNSGQRLRVLIYANNYNAVDNVLLKLEAELGFHAPDARLFRVQSKSRPVPASLKLYPRLSNIELKKGDETTETLTEELRERLFGLESGEGVENDDRITIVGTVPGQLYNLATLAETGLYAPVKDWFDLIIVDEASQMDVAAGAVAFATLASNGACVFAGDDLQLPPIQKGAAPEGLESLVGSLYSYLRDYHRVEVSPLRVNYRSNSTIVEATIEAGYHDARLQAHSPALRLGLQAPLPTLQPADWPAAVVPFDEVWAQLLDPEKPLTCFVYDDALSGQSNDFEAQVTAALLRMLSYSLGPLWNRLDAQGLSAPRESRLYKPDEFWREGVGVVAPHRAQGSRIADFLRASFPTSGSLAPTPEMVGGAVDTVERYQGQQRDVIVASFGLGDPDLIALEDEFLYDLRRFNVLVSRACAKVVVLLSRSVLEHLSNDQSVVRESRLLKTFVEMTCKHESPIALPFYNADGSLDTKNGLMRWY